MHGSCILPERGGARSHCQDNHDILFRGRLIAIGGNEDKVDELVVLKRVVQEVGKIEYKDLTDEA